MGRLSSRITSVSQVYWVVIAIALMLAACDFEPAGPGQQLSATPPSVVSGSDAERIFEATPIPTRDSEAQPVRATPTPSRDADGQMLRPTPTPARGGDGQAPRPTSTPTPGRGADGATARPTSTPASSGPAQQEGEFPTSANPIDQGELLLAITPTPWPSFSGSLTDLETGIPDPVPHECYGIFIGDALIGQPPCTLPTQNHPDYGPPDATGDDTAPEPEVSEESIPKYFDHFEVQATGQSWANSYLLALTSDYAYFCALCEGGSEDSDKWFEDLYLAWGMNKVDHLSETTLLSDTQAVVMSNDQIVIVVFRGTEQKLNDFLSDGAIAMVPVPNWREEFFSLIPFVHGGFYNAQAQSYSSLLSLIYDHMAPHKTLWLTGHSLGGALASLVAYNLEKVEGIPVRGVYTYGSPRTGEDVWVHAYHNLVVGKSLTNPIGIYPFQTLGNKTFRWVNDRDFVPRLPTWESGYRHVGRTNNIYEDGDIHLDDPEQVILHLSYFDHYGYPARIYDELPASIKADMPPPN